MFNATTIGKRIKDLRGKIPQEQCAKDLGISRGALSFYENGERKPDAEILVRMCEYFKVSADYLLGLSDVKSADSDVRKVCEFTRLSEKAVDNISQLKDVAPLTADFFMESPSLLPLLFEFEQLYQYRFEPDFKNDNSIAKKDLENLFISAMNVGAIAISNPQYADFLQFKITQLFECLKKDIEESAIDFIRRLASHEKK